MGTRSLVLVRHGQYDPESGGSLTPLGREQAALTSAWLASRHPKVDAIWTSTLPRARETAEIVRRPYPKVRVREAAVLREGLYSKVRGYDVSAEERASDRTRADRAWLRFFRVSRMDRLELVVCHGNLIRYLVCRALDVPTLRWTRMNSHHCAITTILVRDTKAVRVVSYNETAHLPVSCVT
jgi:serine/threonine-protein phosphatase PGAM5